MRDEEWRLTPEGWEFTKGNMDELMKIIGMDRIIEGLKAKFASKEWLLAEHGKKHVEVWSLTDRETVTILDDEILSNARDKDGNLLPPNDAVFIWVALKLIAARDAEDHELTPEGVQIRKWLKTLPIDRDVIDGSCIDNYLQDKGIAPLY